MLGSTGSWGHPAVSFRRGRFHTDRRPAPKPRGQLSHREASSRSLAGCQDTLISSEASSDFWSVPICRRMLAFLGTRGEASGGDTIVGSVVPRNHQAPSRRRLDQPPQAREEDTSAFRWERPRRVEIRHGRHSPQNLDKFNPEARRPGGALLESASEPLRSSSPSPPRQSPAPAQPITLIHSARAALLYPPQRHAAFGDIVAGVCTGEPHDV